MTNEPKIICFDSGLQIVAEVEEAETLDAIGVIKVHYPMEILRVPMSMTHEAYSIRPWMSFSSATVFEVNKNNVVAMAPLGEGYYEGYENLKNGYFNKPMGLPSSDFEEYYEENEEPPMDEDTLKEMIDEVLGKKKRILH
jgi:hypothetical protein|tara:strand:- start:347 stop:766 length:420 start_codon:yes stop_codon:yes gene_type:complete